MSLLSSLRREIVVALLCEDGGPFMVYNVSGGVVLATSLVFV